MDQMLIDTQWYSIPIGRFRVLQLQWNMLGLLLSVIVACSTRFFPCEMRFVAVLICLFCSWIAVQTIGLLNIRYLVRDTIGTLFLIAILLFGLLSCVCGTSVWE